MSGSGPEDDSPIVRPMNGAAAPADAQDQFEMSNNAGEILDGGMNSHDDGDEYQPGMEDDELNEEVDQAAQRLQQICRYSHKILKKYVVNGMITLQDGPQLHNLVDARDYRIICILEVYSQNKNEDDFLENLGLLTQVIKEQKELEDKEGDHNSYSGEEDFNEMEPVEDDV